jgi:4-amino-4-deoxy-L-arabinose transferase
METHFAVRDLWFIACGLLLFAASLFFFQRGKTNMALLFLVLGGATFRLMLVLMDPFLHGWDEQFHALVAKNLAQHPLHPTLIDHPVMPVNPAEWNSNHTWLHKPPFFLWLMAGSIKLFGSSVFALRLPSLLLCVLLIPVIYRTGKLLLNSATGYAAALLYAASGFQLHLVSGELNTDHNDLIFTALVVLSCWALTEYVCNKPLRWYALLCGLFAGCAVLTKYLPGLLPLGIFGLLLLLHPQWRVKREHWINLTLAALLCGAVYLPWKIYAAAQWPAESAVASEHFTNHLSQEFGHGGPWYFHFAELVKNYGWLFSIAILPGFYFLYRKSTNRSFILALGIATLIVYGFYSFVPIRMPLFCLPVTFILFIAVGALLSELIPQLLRIRYLPKFIGFALLFLALINWVNLGYIEFWHCDRDGKDIYRQSRIYNKQAVETFCAKLPEGAHVFFNCPFHATAATMFYSGQTAYAVLPDEAALQQIRKQHPELHILVFDDGQLPGWIKNNTELQVVPDIFKRTGY